MADVRVTDEAFEHVGVLQVVATLRGHVGTDTVAERVLGRRWLVFGRDGVDVDHGRI